MFYCQDLDCAETLAAFNRLPFIFHTCNTASKWYVVIRTTFSTVRFLPEVPQMFQIREAFLHPWGIMCIFHWQISYGFHLIYAYKDVMFETPKLKLCSIDPEYCVLFLSFVMWLRINAESTVSSMRLQCTAIKECLKYRNKCVYVRSFVPKMIHTLCGNNGADIRKKYSAFQTNNISESGFTLWKCFLKVFSPNGCITFWNESLHLFFTPNDMFHIYTVCVWFVQ